MRVVVPEFDVECFVDYDSASLPQITAEAVAAYCGPGYNRDYFPLYDVSWEDVKEILEIERAALDRAGQAADAAEFEELLGEVVDDAYEDDDFDFFNLTQGLDLGVAGLVMAIVAAGGTTYTSCRGRATGSLHLQAHPFVGVVLDAERAALIADLVRSETCCLYTTEDGYLAIEAPSVEHCHRLASLVVDKKALFEPLPPPDWREGLDEQVV